MTDGSGRTTWSITEINADRLGERSPDVSASFMFNFGIIRRYTVMQNPGRTFQTGAWEQEINVRDFIQKNYTPYDGDEAEAMKEEI